ncbi:MAG: dehydrogenase [Bacteroidales bacterium]|nr:dehydrogenase [Bacteroidales bacterium]
MIIRSKAPLRLGLAGGGTDVSPYSEIFGGAVLNATINLYAYATIIPGGDKTLFRAEDKNEAVEIVSETVPGPSGSFTIAKGVYNRVISEFRLKPSAFSLTTYVDAPAGSGLGSSSTLAVAILGAFAEWYRLPLGEYDIARLAWDIERNDLGMAGGKQDQYAATFGGFNFMEFSGNGKVIVNPLRIRDQILNELSNNILLYYTSTSRLSSSIIAEQQRNVRNEVKVSVEAMHRLKELSVRMKEVILKGELDELGELFNLSWEYKKQMAGGITNRDIDRIYEAALDAGATGGKISGAGGGGFIFFYCPGNTRYRVLRALEQFGGREQKYQFTKNGLVTWTI